MKVEPDARHHLFERALQRAEWTLQQLWLQSLHTGGTASVFDLEAFLYGLAPLAAGQQDVLAHVLNERLSDLYESAKLPYLVTPSAPPPAGEDPLAVLHELLAASLCRNQPVGPADGQPGRPAENTRTDPAERSEAAPGEMA